MMGTKSDRKRISLRKTIDAKCKECIYDSYGGTGTWRQQVAACASISCPLFPVRPMPAIGKGADNPVKAPKPSTETRSPHSLSPPIGLKQRTAEKGSFEA
jgi:hypothetical protein